MQMVVKGAILEKQRVREWEKQHREKERSGKDAVLGKVQASACSHTRAQTVNYPLVFFAV